MRAAVMFSGAAGSSLGAQQAGAQIVWAANHAPLCIDVHRANFPAAEHVCEDLVRFDLGLMAEHDGLVASPVCRGHSRAGRPGRARNRKVASKHNKHRATMWSVIDALEIHEPRWFVVENVPELREWNLFRGWLACIHDLGYSTTVECMNAVQWGVPQRRERLFVVGLLGGGAVDLRPSDVPELGIEKAIDWEAGRWLEFKRCQGDEAREQLHEAHRRFKGGPAFTLQVDGRPVLSAAEPMHTMTTKLMSQTALVYRGRYRKPLVREAFNLMGFPRSYVIPRWVGKTAAYEMAGDAVCPPIMKAIVERVLEAV